MREDCSGLTSNERKDLWKKRLADYAASGQKVTTWCEENAITSRQFYYWHRKLGIGHLEKKQPIKWLSLKYESPLMNIAEGSITVHIGKAAVELHKGFDRELFGEIAQVLQAI